MPFFSSRSISSTRGAEPVFLHLGIIVQKQNVPALGKLRSVVAVAQETQVLLIADDLYSGDDLVQLLCQISGASPAIKIS